MKRRMVLSTACLIFGLSSTMEAHFKLLSPAPWIQESDDFGDPQWSFPCGGTLTDPGVPTGIVTKLQGGEKLHLRIREMAFHPGFYRVSLAVLSRHELPPDPEPVNRIGSDGRQHSVAGTVLYPPQPPVLADGLFMHDKPFDKDQEADITIPNIECAKCTLQVIEFMADHVRNPDGDYTYHHCAELQIRANPEKPIDTRFLMENKKH
jgi:hypothetical protein